MKGSNRYEITVYEDGIACVVQKIKTNVPEGESVFIIKNTPRTILENGITVDVLSAIKSEKTGRRNPNHKVRVTSWKFPLRHLGEDIDTSAGNGNNEFHTNRRFYEWLLNKTVVLKVDSFPEQKSVSHTGELLYIPSINNRNSDSNVLFRNQKGQVCLLTNHVNKIKILNPIEKAASENNNGSKKIKSQTPEVKGNKLAIPSSSSSTNKSLKKFESAKETSEKRELIYAEKDQDGVSVERFEKSYYEKLDALIDRNELRFDLQRLDVKEEEEGKENIFKSDRDECLVLIKYRMTKLLPSLEYELVITNREEPKKTDGSTGTQKNTSSLKKVWIPKVNYSDDDEEDGEEEEYEYMEDQEVSTSEDESCITVDSKDQKSESPFESSERYEVHLNCVMTLKNETEGNFKHASLTYVHQKAPIEIGGDSLQVDNYYQERSNLETIKPAVSFNRKKYATSSKRGDNDNDDDQGDNYKTYQQPYARSKTIRDQWDETNDANPVSGDNVQFVLPNSVSIEKDCKVQKLTLFRKFGIRSQFMYVFDAHPIASKVQYHLKWKTDEVLPGGVYHVYDDDGNLLGDIFKRTFYGDKPCQLVLGNVTTLKVVKDLHSTSEDEKLKHATGNTRYVHYQYVLDVRNLDEKEKILEILEKKDQANHQIVFNRIQVLSTKNPKEKSVAAVSSLKQDKNKENTTVTIPHDDDFKPIRNRSSITDSKKPSKDDTDVYVEEDEEEDDGEDYSMDYSFRCLVPGWTHLKIYYYYNVPILG